MNQSHNATRLPDGWAAQALDDVARELATVPAWLLPADLAGNLDSPTSTTPPPDKETDHA